MAPAPESECRILLSLSELRPDLHWAIWVSARWPAGLQTRPPNIRHYARVVDETDWRLMGQETWLTGRPLRWSEWFTNSPQNDHDHCELCTGEFGAVKSDHVEFVAGYVTADDNDHWICSACFEDFRDRFAWTVVLSER